MPTISLPGQLFRTRLFTCGVPDQFTVSENGMTVLFLRGRAGDDPARWGPWVVPCPIRDSDINVTQQAMHTKSRMDQRISTPSIQRYAWIRNQAILFGLLTPL